MKKATACIVAVNKVWFSIAENIWLNMKPMLMITIRYATFRLKSTTMFLRIIITEQMQKAMTVPLMMTDAIRNLVSVSYGAG